MSHAAQGATDGTPNKDGCVSNPLALISRGARMTTLTRGLKSTLRNLRGPIGKWGGAAGGTVYFAHPIGSQF